VRLKPHVGSIPTSGIEIKFEVWRLEFEDVGQELCAPDFVLGD